MRYPLSRHIPFVPLEVPIFIVLEVRVRDRFLRINRTQTNVVEEVVAKVVFSFHVKVGSNVSTVVTAISTAHLDIKRDD